MKKNGIILGSSIFMLPLAFGQNPLLLNPPTLPRYSAPPSHSQMYRVDEQPTFSRESRATQNPVVQNSKPAQYSQQTDSSFQRMIFLNGTNIQNVRNQEMENVNLHIDSYGNVYISAPHYDVHTEQSYHPLLPNEIPKLPKPTTLPSADLPEGIYSKSSGEMIKPQRENDVTNGSEIKNSLPFAASEIKKPENPK